MRGSTLAERVLVERVIEHNEPWEVATTEAMGMLSAIQMKFSIQFWMRSQQFIAAMLDF